MIKKINETPRKIETIIKINSCYLRAKMLYWACYTHQDLNLIEQIYELNRIDLYLEAPLEICESMNVFHACAMVGNYESLKFLLGKVEQFHAEKFKELPPSSFLPKIKIFNIQNNRVFCIPKDNLKLYNKKFIDRIKLFSNFIIKFEKYLLNKYQNNKKINYQKKFFDSRDIYGNTPLHLASILGNFRCVEILIKKGKLYVKLIFFFKLFECYNKFNIFFI